MRVQTETKPGIRTTEFWLSIAAVISSALILFGAIPIPDGLPRWVTYVAGVATVIGYTIARALAKLGVPQEKLIVNPRDEA